MGWYPGFLYLPSRQFLLSSVNTRVWHILRPRCRDGFRTLWAGKPTEGSQTEIPPGVTPRLGDLTALGSCGFRPRTKNNYPCRLVRCTKMRVASESVLFPRKYLRRRAKVLQKAVVPSSEQVALWKVSTVKHVCLTIKTNPSLP